MDFKKRDASDKTLPDRVKMDKKFFDQIKNKVWRARKNNLHDRPTGYSKIIFLDNASRLIENTENGEITHEEALKVMDTIDKDIKAIVDQKRLTKIKLKKQTLFF